MQQSESSVSSSVQVSAMMACCGSGDAALTFRQIRFDGVLYERQRQCMDAKITFSYP